MTRSATTASQSNALANPKDLSTSLRVSVDDGSGVYANLSSLEGYNWIRSVSYEEASGKPVATASVKLAREVYKLSLSPFVDGSKLNAGGTVIDIARKILIETAVLPRGKAPASDEWEKVFRGYIEKIAWAKSPIVLTCHDLGAELLRRFIETQRVYAETDNLLHEVIQDIVDDTSPDVETVAANFTWDGTTTIAATGADTSEIAVNDYVGYLRSAYFKVTAITPNVDLTIDNAGGRTIPTGAGANSSVLIAAADRITLYVEGANPAWAIGKYWQTKDRVLSAIRKLAQQIGYEVSYRWNSGTSDFELTLWTPDRAAVTPDFTIGPGAYKRIEKLDLDRSKIRNKILITAMVAGVRTTVTRSDATSIAKYGTCYMEATEKSSSQIDTVAEMQDFGDVILGDLKEPEADAVVTIPYRWDLQPADYGRFEADGVRFDTDQDLGVVRLKHTLPQAGEPITSIAVRGKPGGGVNRWLEIEGMPGVASPVDLKSDDAASGLAVETNPGSIIVTYDDPRSMTPPVDDWSFTECHVATSSGFTPGAGTLKAKGKSTRFEVGGLVPGTVYYVKLVMYDEAGNAAATSAQVTTAVQEVGEYHINPDTQTSNLIRNGDFGQSTFDIATTPPDAWELESGDDWGAADEVFHSTTIQETGYRSLHFIPSKHGYVYGPFLPCELNTLYRVLGAARADSVTAGHRIRFAYDRHTAALDRANPAASLIDTVIWSDTEVAVANTWETRDTIRYLASGAETARFVRPHLGVPNQNFNGYVDRYVISRARQSFGIYRANARSISDSTWTLVDFDATVTDFGGINIGGTEYGIDPANGRYTCLEPGQYAFETRVGLDDLADQKSFLIGFYVNGVISVRGNRVQASGAQDVGIVMSATFDLVKGDYVEVYVYHKHGAARSLLVGSAETWFTGGRVE